MPELFYYINYVTLAHLIMGDGIKQEKGIMLCTDSFSLKEIILLMNILKIKFDIVSTATIYFRKNYLLKDRKII